MCCTVVNMTTVTRRVFVITDACNFLIDCRNVNSLRKVKHPKYKILSLMAQVMNLTS